jgi:Tfp pilus assembly protein PilV
VSPRRGFGLAEAVVSAAIFVIMIGLVGYVLVAGHEQTSRQQKFLAVQDNAMAALHRMARDLRESAVEKIVPLYDGDALTNQSVKGVAIPSARSMSDDSIQIDDQVPKWSAGRWVCYFVDDSSSGFGKALYRCEMSRGDAPGDFSTMDALTYLDGKPRVMVAQGIVPQGLEVDFDADTVATLQRNTDKVLVPTPHTQAAGRLRFTRDGFLLRVIRPSDGVEDGEPVQVSGTRVDVAVTTGTEGIGSTRGGQRYNLASAMTEVMVRNQ